MKIYKRISAAVAFLVLAVLTVSSCKYIGIDAISGSTLVWQSGSNNFFNQEAPTTLDGTKYIILDGEVEKEVKLKLSKMPLRSVTVRETRLSGHPFRGTIIENGAFKGEWNDSLRMYVPETAPVKEAPVQIAPDGAPSITGKGLDFYGTYRYDGYALCDILSALKVDKLSKEEFWPPVDLYVEVSNDAGDKAVFSWGELFYSADMYSIIIAKRVTRVITGKTGELWALPSQMQIVVKSDMYCERNIPNPTRITVKSLKGNYIVNRDSTVFIGQPDRVDISVTEESTSQTSFLGSIIEPDASIPQVSYPEIYYGHGMGYKGERTFSGRMLRDVLAPYFSRTDVQGLREGIVSVAAIDGYRASFSLSELINRNDAAEVLLMHSFGKGEESGRETFSVSATCDAFADRSIKGLTEIRLIRCNSADPADKKGTITIFHAGSLSLPLKAAADSFRVMHPEVMFEMEAAGSIDCARKITELGRCCDILASADYSVIDQLLIPEYAAENIPFAGNELSIVYTDKSKYASEINSSNWYEILQRPDVFFGRADPNADPCGYRTLLMLQLAEKYYGKPILKPISSKDERFIRPKEVDLISFLETKAIDYIFIYKSIAVQHNLKYIRLPDEINLSRPDMKNLYSEASVEVRGKKPGETVIMTGTPMTYSLTVPKCAKNPELAMDFVDYLLSPNGGQKILKDMGQSTVR